MKKNIEEKAKELWEEHGNTVIAYALLCGSAYLGYEAGLWRGRSEGIRLMVNHFTPKQN